MRHKPTYKRQCETCYGCVKTGERTYVCDNKDDKKIVIKDGRRTEYYLQCRNGKPETNVFKW